MMNSSAEPDAGERSASAMRPPSSGAIDTSAEDDADSGVGQKFVGALGISIVAAFIVISLILATYCLVVVWPSNDTGNVTASGSLFGAAFRFDREQQLFVVVALAGLLGGLIHSCRSLYWYAGNRVLRRSWLLMYICLPLVGGALAVVFCLILRGGLIAGDATSAQVNVYGFGAISALVGLFSSEAAEKLRQIFSTMLAPAWAGRDQLTERAHAVAERFEPRAGPAGTIITVFGRNLSRTTAVLFQGGGGPATVVSDTEVQSRVPAGASTGRIRLVVGDRIVSVPGVFQVED